MRYNPHDQLFLTAEQPVVTTQFLLEMLDSALIENVQRGNLEAAYGVLDLSVSLQQTVNGTKISEQEGQLLLSKVKKAMDKGNIANAKQQMVEFALR